MTNKWPAWFYGPNSAAKIFSTAADVPEGWQDHPSKVITPESTGSKSLPPSQAPGTPGQRGAAPVDPGKQTPAKKAGSAAV